MKSKARERGGGGGHGKHHPSICLKAPPCNVALTNLRSSLSSLFGFPCLTCLGLLHKESCKALSRTIGVTGADNLPS